MNSHNKKIMGLLIAVILCAALIPTVAFAEDPVVTNVAELKAAVAIGGNVFKLANDIDLGSETLQINENVTIDGQGQYKIASTAKKTIEVYESATFRNLTVENGFTGVGGRAIDIRQSGSVIAVEITDSVLKSTAGSNSQPLTVGGDARPSNAITNITVTNSSIIAGEPSGYAVITFNPVNMTIDNSTLSGYAAIYAKPADGSAGSAGSTFTVKNSSKLISSNPFNGESNAFSTIEITDKDVTVTVDSSSTIETKSSGDQPQFVVSIDSSNQSDVEVKIEGTVTNTASGEGKVAFINGYDENSNAALSFPEEFADELAAEGLVTETVNGVSMVKSEGVVQIGTTKYKSLALALAAITDDTPTTIVLLADIEGSMDVGNSKGTKPRNIILDLNEHTLTVRPAVGSSGTVSNGIRVLAKSELIIKNGKLILGKDEADNVKIGIANYSKMTLEDVEIENGPKVIYPINNRGTLKLLGKTIVPNGTVDQTDYTPNGKVAITNDPYVMYYDSPNAAEIEADSADVEVGNIQIETYNNGDINLEMSAGTFGELSVTQSGEVKTNVKGSISGGTFASAVPAEYCADGFAPSKNEDGTYGVHQHVLTKTEKKDATCTADGNVEYWYCNICDTYFSDAAGNNVIEKDNTTIKSQGHKYENGACKICAAPDPSATGGSDGGTGGSVAGGDTNSGKGDEAPKAGDNSNVVLWFALMAVAVVAAVIAKKKCFTK